MNTFQNPELIHTGYNANLSDFGFDLYEWLQSDERLILLDGAGWMDGGCMVLALGLESWSKGFLKPVAWCSPNIRLPQWEALSQGGALSDNFQFDGSVAKHYGITPEHVIVQHYAARLDLEGTDPVFLDGNGLSSEDEFKQIMAFEMSIRPQNKLGFGFWHPNTESLIEQDRNWSSNEKRVRPEISVQGLEHIINALAGQLKAEFGDFKQKDIAQVTQMASARRQVSKFEVFSGRSMFGG